MAHATYQLVEALRQTAQRLRSGANYSWGHHGACNCGNLLQVVTKMDESEIRRYAQTAIGEWTELAQEFCPTTGTPLGLIISQLEKIGLTPTDIHHIEYLTDKEVLNNLPGGFRWLKRNKKEDAIVYFETFANLLEEKLLQQISIDINAITVSATPVLA
jgi:hypothetical protein